MSQDTFRAVLIILIIFFAIAFLAIVADVMTKYPAIPWFGFGMLAILVLEVIGYGIYCLVKYIRGRKQFIHLTDK